MLDTNYNTYHCSIRMCGLIILIYLLNNGFIIEQLLPHENGVPMEHKANKLHGNTLNIAEVLTHC